MISSSFGHLSPWEKFSCGVLSTLCTRIPIQTESLDWIFSYHIFVERLCFTFKNYCSARRLSAQACLLTDILPQEIQNCPFDDVRSYFKWVKSLQNFLCSWQIKFLDEHVSYDEIKMYGDNIENIMIIGRSVCALTYVMDIQYISRVEKTFTQCFELLNCCLLRYVPDHPEVKYCTLPELLHCYGVSFPPELQETLQHKIIFPGNEMEVPDEQKLKFIISPSPNNAFNPGQDISLMVTKSLSLYDLQKILKNLQIFLDPIIDHIEMFVFFHLHKSEMFTKHLLKCLNDISAASSPNKPEKTFLNLPSSIRPSLTFTKSVFRQAKDEGIPIKVLQRALDGVKDLLLKFVKGTATYSDIVADGTINHETLSTEKELAVLTVFAEMNGYACENVDGVKSMLDLFQIISNIGQIKEVCEQYGLEKCLTDANLKKMIEIAEELKVEQFQAKLTSADAKCMMAFIKKTLCLEQCNNYNCLDLFTTVAESSAFYQFVKERQLVGIARESVVNDQLQHISNSLMDGVTMIAPFTDSSISFHDLMTRVVTNTSPDSNDNLKRISGCVTFIRPLFNHFFTGAEVCASTVCYDI